MSATFLRVLRRSRGSGAGSLPTTTDNHPVAPSYSSLLLPLVRCRPETPGLYSALTEGACLLLAFWRNRDGIDAARSRFRPTLFGVAVDSRDGVSTVLPLAATQWIPGRSKAQAMVVLGFSLSPAPREAFCCLRPLAGAT